MYTCMYAFIDVCMYERIRAGTRVWMGTEAPLQKPYSLPIAIYRFMNSEFATTITSLRVIPTVTSYYYKS